MEVKTLITLLSLLLLSFNANAAPSSNTAVLDISGKKLVTGVKYYIVPVIRGRGGGLTLAASGNRTCPLDVVQAPLETSLGLPVTFAPARPSGRALPLSADLNVKFSAATVCVQSTVWKLDAFDEVSRQWFVTSGGVEGNPGRDTISNWFKIERHGDSVGDYKLVFCPTVCDFCKVLCRDVGVFVEDGLRRLALSDEPFVVRFKRA